MESHKELELILSVTPPEKTEEVKTKYADKGMIETVSYLADTLWDDETRQLAQKAVKDKDRESKYYKLLSHKELGLLLSVTPSEKTKEVKTKYAEEGMVETVSYLADTLWDDETRQLAQKAIKDRDTENKYYKLLFEPGAYNVKEHFSQVDSHRAFIKKAYERLREFVPNMTPKEVEVHDLSKYDLTQSIGYTARWVHMIDNDCWKRGLDDHYRREPHHPQYYKPGEPMERKYLEESVIDMVASRWERQLKGDENVTNYELVDFNPVFLKRYVPHDFKEVEALVERIKNSSSQFHK